MSNLTQLNADNFNEFINSDKPVVVDFWASWCGPCQMMAPVFEELANDYAKDGIKLGKLSTEEHPEIAQDSRIQGIPALIIFKNGKELDRVVGFAPKDVLKAKIDSIIQ
jgi:thioredoxin 1